MVESHKFNRIYPLTQNDIPWREITHHHAESEHQIGAGKGDSQSVMKGKNEESHQGGKEQCDRGMLTIEYDRVRDYTPPEYITLLFTDLGVLTPGAVSDEVIKLYQ